MVCCYSLEFLVSSYYIVGYLFATWLCLVVCLCLCIVCELLCWVMVSGGLVWVACGVVSFVTLVWFVWCLLLWFGYHGCCLVLCRLWVAGFGLRFYCRDWCCGYVVAACSGCSCVLIVILAGCVYCVGLITALVVLLWLLLVGLYLYLLVVGCGGSLVGGYFGVRFGFDVWGFRCCWFYCCGCCVVCVCDGCWYSGFCVLLLAVGFACPFVMFVV